MAQQLGNPKDRGAKAVIRYLKIAPHMWKSPVNDAVVASVSPKADETALDLGAGMGPGVVNAAARGATVKAVDPTPFMRAIMNVRRLFSRHRKKIHVLDGAAEVLPAADGEIDALWSVNTMHHWINVEEGAAEIARVLAPGARLLLVDENFADERHPRHESWKQRHLDNPHHGFSMVDATAMGDLFSQAGLVDVIANDQMLGGRPVIAVAARAPR